jgi:hypothetical protein
MIKTIAGEVKSPFLRARPDRRANPLSRSCISARVDPVSDLWYPEPVSRAGDNPGNRILRQTRGAG